MVNLGSKVMDLKREDHHLNDAFYRTLLESTKAIPWQIDWQTMTFSYIGPQIKELLGWETDSWLSANDWAERMHPEDRDWVVDFCISQSKDGVDHEADYRALTKDGDYVWIRDVVHVIRNENGETVSLVGFMFDINERKKNEEELLMLKQELEEFSYQDSLTGVANRRLYDSFMAREWDLAIRNHTAISMIMIDIDFFKQYNDQYGHHAGDLALTAIATTLKSSLRSVDIVARIGGEEFVIVMPESTLEDAVDVAERIRRKIESTVIEHNSEQTFLTASFGVGTIFPKDAEQTEIFIEQVDQLLYAAKECGRNQVKAIS